MKEPIVIFGFMLGLVAVAPCLIPGNDCSYNPCGWYQTYDSDTTNTHINNCVIEKDNPITVTQKTAIIKKFKENKKQESKILSQYLRYLKTAEK